MLHFFYKLPDIYLFILLTFFLIVMSMFAVVLIRSFIPKELRYQDNAIIGNVSALISIIYGVLAGLTALYLINNINDTNVAVHREADAIANIYRDSKRVQEPTRSEIQTELKDYLNHVINVEWNSMREDNVIDDEGDDIISNMANIIGNYNATNSAGVMMMHDMLEEVKSLYNARQERIHISFRTLNPAIWIVLLIGTFLTLAITYLYEMNFYLHLVTVSAVALMLAAMIYLLVTLDRPFQGEFGIEPQAFNTVLKLVESNSNKKPQ